MSGTSLTFYTNPQSRGRMVRWMLEEVGEPYETKVVQFGAEIKSEAYLAINPMGKVPVIVHNGVAVTESAAICAYLADAFPAAGLAPPVGERGAYYRWLFFIAGPLEAAITDRHLGIEDISADRRPTVGYGSYDQAVDALDGMLAGRACVAGNTFSAADVYVGSQLNFGMMFGTLPSRASFVEYVARLVERPAFTRASELDDALPKAG